MAVVLAAHRQLLELERQQLQLHELQGAQLCSLLYNINRDQRKGKATTHQDWLFFRQEVREESDQLPAVVAHVCLALRHEDKLPPLLIGIWKEVLKRSAVQAELPEIRALVSEDRCVVLVAPTWEGSNLRGFLAVKGYPRHAVVSLQDVDRPMLTYSVKLPAHIQAVHFEAGVLLVNQEASSSRLLGASST